MKRTALYSRRLDSLPKQEDLSSDPSRDHLTISSKKKRHRIKRKQFERVLLLSLGALLGIVVILSFTHQNQALNSLTQEQIDAAVLHTLNTKDLPSRTTRAATVIAPSIVKIRTDIFAASGGTQIFDGELGIGTGIVIKDDGTILTNLHVVANAPRLIVTFADGMESPAVIISAQKDKDLAVIKPTNIPDDLEPATLGSSKNIMVGDEIAVIGYPFGVGPSVSAGVISGLNREYKPTENLTLKGLIQFDAAANPGNSGGPLVNMSGEVLGIVTAILNPTNTKTFAGIGFAITIDSAGDSLGIPPF